MKAVRDLHVRRPRTVATPDNTPVKKRTAYVGC
jgi:hypothetical protein